MSPRSLLVQPMLIIIAAVAAGVGAANNQVKEPSVEFTVVGNGDGTHASVFRVQHGRMSGTSVANGKFEDRLLTTGWGILNVATNSDYPDREQAFAAGMLEGWLTAQHIFDAQRNLYPNVFGKNVTSPKQVAPEIREFLDRQEAWTRVMVDKSSASDPFWAQVGNVMAQFDGLVEGYAAVARSGKTPELDRFSFVMLNGVGDLFDIVPAVKEDERIEWLKLGRKEAERRHTHHGHCSGLIKVPGDFSDLFMAHSSWFTYSNTNRIFKHYNLNFTDPSTAARRVSMSSYPGFLESLDDFYLLDSGLGWIQTTNTVLNHSTYDEVKPESLLAWQRVRVASAMAHTGKEWYEHLSRYFSGTYANQYMIVDFKLFEPKKAIRRNTLWVVEEMPGLVVGGDSSETLSRGYWPSYNVPYWPEVYAKSGYPAMAAKHGEYYSYELCPRAKIFRRDQAKVVDMPSFKALMRSNDFLRDPYAVDPDGVPNPSYAICSRGDLHPENATAEGCYDTKVTSYNSGAMQLRAHAVNGPTSESLPPFTWHDRKWANEAHVGLPANYTFDFVETEPAAHIPAAVAAVGVAQDLYTHLFI